MKIAIVHDYLLDYGGAEEVLVVLHETFPEAPIYLSLLDKKGLGKFWQKFEDAKIITSWFNRLPFASKLISPLRFMIPLIWSSFDFSEYDVVITSASWAVTKGIKKGKGTIEVCYLHTPPRYLYGYETSRKWKGKWYGFLIDIYAKVVNKFMRAYDFRQAQKVNYFIANSKNVGKRIEKFYKRTDYKVIYPPINIPRIKPTDDKDNYFITGGRMTAAKNFDLIIKACQNANVKLKVFGGGVYEEYLKSIVRGETEFMGKINDQEKTKLMLKAKAFILAQIDEDFGMTALEAAACGCPAIAFRGGGYVESVIENKTGIFFNEATVESLSEAIQKFERMKFDPQDCIAQAKKFSKERFQTEIRRFIEQRIHTDIKRVK